MDYSTESGKLPVKKKSEGEDVPKNPFTKLREMTDFSEKLSGKANLASDVKEDVVEEDAEFGRMKKIPTMITGAGKSAFNNIMPRYTDKSRVSVIRKQNLNSGQIDDKKKDDTQCEGSLLSMPEPSKIVVGNLWAISVGHLFGKAKWHRKWAADSIKEICDYLGLADSVCQTLLLHKDYYSDFKAEQLQGSILKLKEDLVGDEFSSELIHYIPKELVALQVRDGHYDARARVTIKFIAEILDASWEVVDSFEWTLVKSIESLRKKEEEKIKNSPSQDKQKKVKRAVLVGLATIGGGAALALSAGLAAPLIGAGAVAVLGSSAAGVLTGASGLAIITSIFGAAGAGLTGYKMSRRIGEIEQFEFDALDNMKHLHITLAISGWLSTVDDSGFSIPWWSVSNSSEQYCLKWEGRYLRELGTAITSFIRKEVVSTAVKEGLKRTVLSAFLKSIAWPLALINAAYIIDNPWNVCTSRAKEAGKQLAEVLYERHQGSRPITLIGFSLGARVIFFCLQALAAKEGSEGIVEDVVLLGAPVTAKPSEWECLGKVVSGKMYNCFSRMDWMLKFVYRTASVAVGDIAGLGPINVDLPRLYNHDITEEIGGHSDYANPRKIWNALKLINFPTRDIENLLEILESEEEAENEDKSGEKKKS